MTFYIEITKSQDGLFLASALGFIGGGNTVKGALDAWTDAIVDHAIYEARRRQDAEDSIGRPKQGLTNVLPLKKIAPPTV